MESANAKTINTLQQPTAEGADCSQYNEDHIANLQFLKTTVTIEMHQSPTTGELQLNSYPTDDPVRQTEASTEVAKTLRSTSNCIVRQTIKSCQSSKELLFLFFIV